MTTTITIKDYPCGSGKTTSMIESFKQEEKYIVILPYLSEVDRIIESTTNVSFVEPKAEDNIQNTKTESLKELLLTGQNIATTHSMYERLVPLAEEGLLDDYNIYVQSINYPTVEEGTERLRIAPTPLHTDAMMGDLVEAIRKVFKRCRQLT